MAPAKLSPIRNLGLRLTAAPDATVAVILTDPVAATLVFKKLLVATDTPEKLITLLREDIIWLEEVIPIDKAGAKPNPVFPCRELEDAHKDAVETLTPI